MVRYDGYGVETATRAKVCMCRKQEPAMSEKGKKWNVQTKLTFLTSFPPYYHFSFLLFDFFLHEPIACMTLNRLPRSNDNANSSDQPNSPSMKNSAFVNACKEMRK